MIEDTPAITITLPIQKPGAPDTLLRMRIRALGNARHVQAGPLASHEAFQGRGGWKKIFKPPKPERGGGSLML